MSMVPRRLRRLQRLRRLSRHVRVVAGAVLIVAATPLVSCFDGDGPPAVDDLGLLEMSTSDGGRGSDATRCECTVLKSVNDCSGGDVTWGCKNAPAVASISADLDPTCLEVQIDPQTGCPRPVETCDLSCLGPGVERCDEKVIGRWCSVDDKTTCPGSIHVCLPISGARGICTCACTPDDPSTLLITEDSCPHLSKARCGLVDSPSGPGYYCMTIKR